jgi:hypothetical protein
MIRGVHSLLFTAALLLLAASAIAEQLDVSTILAKQKSGASAEALLAAVNDPANTLAIRADDIASLRSGGVPEGVIAAVQQRIANQAAPPPVSAPAPVAPDDARLADVVKLAKSGISESLIAEQIKQSGAAYKLSMNDLLYLKQNSVQDSVISALLATKDQEAKKAAAGPAETAFNELLLVHGWGPMRRERPGRLLLKGDTFSWIDGADPKENFEFQTAGLEKVWLHLPVPDGRGGVLPDQLPNREGAALRVRGRKPRHRLERDRKGGHGNASQELSPRPLRRTGPLSQMILRFAPVAGFQETMWFWSP